MNSGLQTSMFCTAHNQLNVDLPTVSSSSYALCYSRLAAAGFNEKCTQLSTFCLSMPPLRCLLSIFHLFLLAYLFTALGSRMIITSSLTCLRTARGAARKENEFKIFCILWFEIDNKLVKLCINKHFRQIIIQSCFPHEVLESKLFNWIKIL